MSLVCLFLAAILSTGQAQLYGDNSKIGYSGTVYKDDKNVVTGYGQVQPRPLELGAGANWKNSQNHGLGLDLTHQPKPGVSTATLSGQLGLINKPNDQVYAYGSHSRAFDNKFDTIGRSSSAGLGYQHTSRDGMTSVGARAGASFVPGFKPQPNIMFGINHRF